MTKVFDPRACALLAFASFSLPLSPTLVPAADLIDFHRVDLSKKDPAVRFDLPPSVIVHQVEGAEEIAHLAAGEQLLMVELPVSVLVSKGRVDRVREVVIEIDGADAGLTVHDYSPATRLETEFAKPIEVENTKRNERHREISIGGTVSKITPGAGVSRTRNDVETKKLSRRPPKEAIVVSGPINGRRGVLFKFRPSSQTTLEGEHPLRLTFIAPPHWQGGDLDVRCTATGQRKVLFVKQPAVWGRVVESVALRQLGAPRDDFATEPIRQTTAKPVIEPTAAGPVWKPRQQLD